MKQNLPRYNVNYNLCMTVVNTNLVKQTLKDCIWNSI
jgi:hypothetical protein